MAKFGSQQENKGKSPYAKYRKRAHKYSDLFYRWRDARKAGNTSAAEKLSWEHAERFGGPEVIANLKRNARRKKKEAEMPFDDMIDGWDDYERT